MTVVLTLCYSGNERTLAHFTECQSISLIWWQRQFNDRTQASGGLHRTSSDGKMLYRNTQHIQEFTKMGRQIRCFFLNLLCCVYPLVNQPSCRTWTSTNHMLTEHKHCPNKIYSNNDMFSKFTRVTLWNSNTILGHQIDYLCFCLSLIQSKTH